MTESELRIGVSELRRRPGNRMQLERSVPLGPLAISSSSIPEGEEVLLSVTMEALSDGVTLSGTVQVPWQGECRRCLEMTTGQVTVEVAEIFKERTEGELGDILPIANDSIDLGPTVHDAAILALPIAPLCRADCAGPIPELFPVITAETAGAEPIDPRWASLGDLHFDSDPPE